MFLPYRTVGYVIDNNPPILKKFGNQNFLYSTVGRSWQVHNTAKLRLRHTAPERESQITSIAVTDRQVSCTAVGRDIVIWRRIQEGGRITPPMGNNIAKLMAIGDILISLSRDGHLYTWDLGDISKRFAILEQQDALQESSVYKDKMDAIHDPSKATNTSTNTTKANTKTTYMSGDNFSSSASLDDWTPLSHVVLLPPQSPNQQQTTVKHTFGLENQTISTVREEDNAYITSWCHPPTYNNKLVIGWSNGVIELWNIHSGKMIHRFTSHYTTKKPKGSKKQAENKAAMLSAAGLTPLEQTLALQANGGITCLESSLVLDVIAVGMKNGDIILMNLKLDQVIHVYHQDSSVTSLSFRSDNNFQHLVSGSAHGDINLWDLKEKSNISTKPGHTGTVTGAFFLYKEPILITTGVDNSIIQWHFDGTKFSELRSLQGHYRAPTTLKWYSHKELLTGSPDGTLRYWSPYRDRSAQTLSWKAIPNNAHRDAKGLDNGFLTSVNRKVSGLDLTPMYHAGQASAVTLNSGQTDKVTLWEVENIRATKLIGQSLSRAIATCFSFCGQFVFIGYADGEVKKFNIQSGAFRHSFSPDRVITNAHGDAEIEQFSLTANQRKKQRQRERENGTIMERSSANGKIPHQNGIAGVFCGTGNEFLLTVGKDGILYSWDIDREAMLHKLSIDKPVHSLHFSSEFALLGVITTTNEVYLIDCDRLCIVRHWAEHAGRLSQILLHPHLALMFLIDVMGGIRTYDLTSGMMIDHTAFSRPILSIDVCPPSRDSKSSGDMIATTHQGSIGVYLWIINPNRQLFTAHSIHQHYMTPSNSVTTNNQPTSRIELAGGNIALSIDNNSLEKEQKKFQKEQLKLYKLHQAEVNNLVLNEGGDDEDSDEQYTNIGMDDESDNEQMENEEEEQGTAGNNVGKHKLNKRERILYKKMKSSNHFLTVNVVRNMSMFDTLITKPKPNKSDITVDEDNDNDDVKLIKSQRIMQQVLFKQLHNEMNTKLAMLSGIAASRWKLITQQQAIAQRNEKLKQAQIMANENTPFFLSVQTAQKKHDSATTYSLEKGTTLVEQEKAIRGAGNQDFQTSMQQSLRRNGANGMVSLDGSSDPFGNDAPLDLIQQCLQIDTVCNITDFVWQKASMMLFANGTDSDDDDSDDDNVLVSVNDKKHQEKKAKAAAEAAANAAKPKDKKEMAIEKMRLEKERKAKEEAKLLKQAKKQAALNLRRYEVCDLLKYLYLHLLPSNPSQEWIEDYNTKRQEDIKAVGVGNNAQRLQTKEETRFNPFATLLAKNNGAKNSISSLVSQATGKNINTNNQLTQLATKKVQSVAEQHTEHVEALQIAYLNEIKSLPNTLHLSPKLDKKSISPLMSYIMSTPPSLLSAQISSFEDEREIYIFLHTIFIISTNCQGGLIDAIAALVQHTLQQHSLIISESPLLRVLCNLLVKAMSSQWKQIEMLLHSNIAVVNHLAGLHSGF